MNILVIGNGFDLAHGLPTRYLDFLNFFKNTDGIKFSSAIERFHSGKDYGENYKGFINKYSKYLESTDINKIKQIENMLSKNVWAKYYARCEAEIEGWIDFEKEILPVLTLLREVFEQSKYATIYGTIQAPTARIRIEEEILRKKAKILERYFSVTDEFIDVNSDYSGYTYGVYKNKILDDLKLQLDQFVEAFRLYLNVIVEPIDIDLKPIISSIKPDTVISFNYTMTECKYDNLLDANNYHIHGSIDNRDSMVLGVNEVKDDPDNDFVYFVKYFQRIRKRIDQGYKTIYKRNTPMTYGTGDEVIFFGHSLDKTDEDIIKPLIEQARSVKIYYYEDEDYERKVINLINLFNRETIEENMFNGKIELLSST